MKDLIEALTILSNYSNEEYPTWCSHDIFGVAVNSRSVSEEDKKRLGELGFFEHEGGFASYKFGSC